jgi:3-hydroxyisobutyrate dehydrogenase-like beta-hydroxyacid dehydrogenase|tara:strand:+ start:295 stop:1014 length:720 start_codon:yes stop_codon:yes gene_type:complete
MKIGIVGHGQVGQAVAKLYSETDTTKTWFSFDKILIYDPYQGMLDDISDVDILNVCIPYTKDFVPIVKDLPTPNWYTVIHSTVPVGTTEKFGHKFLHSPVRGVHPNLYEGLKTFVKFIGGDEQLAEAYSGHLKTLGVETHICKDAKTTELSKLADTTYYGLCIAFTSDMKKLCDEYDLDFMEVMTKYNNTYNEGYKKLGKPNVVRPVLYPTDKIGGHCVIPNAKLLPRTKLIDGLLDYE